MADMEEGRRIVSTPDQSTIALIFDLKNHISNVNRESTSKWSELVNQVNGKVEKNTADISDSKKSIKRIERNQEEMANGISSSGDGATRMTRIFTGQTAKTDFARRSLRLWPIHGQNDQDVRKEATRFLCEKLLISAIACPEEQIERVTRTRQPRRAKG